MKTSRTWSSTLLVPAPSFRLRLSIGIESGPHGGILSSRRCFGSPCALRLVTPDHMRSAANRAMFARSLLPGARRSGNFVRMLTCVRLVRPVGRKGVSAPALGARTLSTLLVPLDGARSAHRRARRRAFFALRRGLRAARLFGVNTCTPLRVLRTSFRAPRFALPRFAFFRARLAIYAPRGTLLAFAHEGDTSYM